MLGIEEDLQDLQDPVVWRTISANLGLNFNPGFFFFLEHPVTKMQTKRIKLNLLFSIYFWIQNSH